tara:strand:- start:154 stop:7593 length:7440 start_codon:yes stop_codon:yes gene_type:complete
MTREKADEGMYTFWLAGYYDDFMGARVVPDDNNNPNLVWYSSKSHHGNPLNGFAPLNPRYTYAWCERGLKSGGARFNAAALSTTEKNRFNAGISEWATLDLNRTRPETAIQTRMGIKPTGLYEGLAHLQYPDSLTNANRQKFNKAANYETSTSNVNYAAKEGYLLFCNGYDTASKYYAATGTDDSSYGRGGVWNPLAVSSGTTLTSTAGTSGSSRNKIVRTHLAGVYSGEIVDANDISAAAPIAALMPIESPCGKPFLVTEIHQNSTSAYDPIISYDATLNSKGDGDIFTIRICPMAVDTSTARIRLRIGCEGTAFTSAASGDTGYTLAAIDYVITPTAFQEMTTYAGTSMDTLWDDYDFIMDYTNNQYDVVKNGTLILNNQTIANKADGNPFGAADMYGWELDALGCAKKVAVLIDRVGLIRPLNDHPIQTVADTMPVAVDFSLTMGVNSVSSMDCTIIDDDATLKLLPFFNQSAYSDWSLLMFYRRIDRPLWRGGLNSLSYKQTTDYTPTISLKASDYFGKLDNQMPTWELGQGGETDTTRQIAYNRSESQNQLNSYFFGTSALNVANATLGYNEVQDGSGNFKQHLDSRMRNRSAHPIQMYTSEDTIGPNEAYDEWDDAITAGHATSDAAYRAVHTKWMEDLRLSSWFRHMFGKINKTPLFSGNSTGAFTVGATTLSIDGAYDVPTSIGGGSFEVIHEDGFIDSGTYTGIAPTTNKSLPFSKSASPGGYAEGIRLHRTIYPAGMNSHGGLLSAGAYHEEFWYVDLWLPDLPTGGPGGGAWSPRADLYGMTLSITGATGVGTPLNGTWMIGDPITPEASPYTQPWDISNTRTAAVGGATLRRVRLYNLDGTQKRFTESDFPTADWTYAYTGNQAVTIQPGAPGSLQNAESWSFYHNVDINSFTITWGLDLTLPAVNFLQRDIQTTDTINVRSIDSEDFKHMWVLWSDMRNDGKADADSNTRRKQFGLMTPFSSNYGLSLAFSNTNISNTEERQQFVDLKLGEEVDMWEMDGTADPITGEPWSNVYGGSNSLNSQSVIGSAIVAGATSITLANGTSFATAGTGIIGGTDLFTWTGKSTHTLTGVTGVKYARPTGIGVSGEIKYSNWENKGGSFVLFDASKFFNLNTTSNGGKTGQTSGGRKEIGDYLVETEGFPVLIDNYWKKAVPSFLNLDDSASWASNYKYFINEGTTLLRPIKIDDRIMQLTAKDGIIPPIVNQVGMMISAEKKTIFHYAAFAGYDLINTAVVAESNGAGYVKLSLGNADGGAGGGYKAAELYRVGHEIVLSSSSGTTTDIDGTYTVRQVGKGMTIVDMASGTTNQDTVLTIDSNAGFSTAGTGVINGNNTFSWTGKGGSTTLTGCTNLGINPDNSSIIEIGNYEDTGFLEIKVSDSVTITTGTVTVSAPTSIKLKNLCSLGIAVPDTITLGEWDGTAYPAVGTVPSAIVPKNNAWWLTFYGAVGGLPSPVGRSSYVSSQNIEIDPDSTVTYPDMVVYGGLSNVMPMSLLMILNGFIETKGEGTWYDSDKIRTTYLDSLSKNWLSQTTLAGMPDIGSVPVTRNMATVPTSATGELGKPPRGGVVSTVASPGSGLSRVTTTTPHLLNGGETITMVENYGLYSNKIVDYVYKDYVVSAVITDVQFDIPNTIALQGMPGVIPVNSIAWGRWRIADSVDDFGGVNDCRNTTISTIFSSTQALSGVGDNYGGKQVFSWYMGRDSKPAFMPNYKLGLIFNRSNLRVSTMSTQSTKQITNVRVFYGGHGSFVDHPAPVLGTTPRWEILTMPTVSTNSEALKIAKVEYEKYKNAPLSIKAQLLNFTDNFALSGINSVMVDEARHGYIADQSRTIPQSYHGSARKDSGSFWTSLHGGNFFPGMVNALDGRDGDAKLVTDSNLTFDENFWWYGANSVSYAVQVVHMPRGMPKVSQKTAAGSLINADGKLRVAIEVGNGVDYGSSASDGSLVAFAVHDQNPLFTIRLLDYDWTNNTFQAHERSSSMVTVDSNGLYELDIPGTYWSTGRTGTEKIIISVNYDYLNALARRRCDTDDTLGLITMPPPDPSSTAQQEAYVGGVLLPGGYNLLNTPPKSIFPLGMRRYATASYWNLRTEWYAPRLHICDDINFVPGAQVIYDDATLGLSGETMGIKTIMWKQSGRNRETLDLTLERDVSLSGTTFSSLFSPAVTKGNTQTGGEGSSKGGGGSATAGRGEEAEGTTGLPDGFSPSTEAGNNGNPLVGGWGQTGSTGGITPGMTLGSSYNPNNYNGPGSSVDGMTFGDNSSISLSSNNLALGVTNKIKGVMDFNVDSFTGGSFSILGQKKPTFSPRNESGVEGVDSFIIPTSGDGVMSSGGMSFAGATDGTKSFTEFSVTTRVPANAASTKARIEGRYSMDSISTTQVATLNVVVRCIETNSIDTNTVNLNAGSNSNVVLYEGNLLGINVPNNTIVVSIGRDAGTAPDTATYSAVTLHNVQIATDRRSVSGAVQGKEFSYSA